MDKEKLLLVFNNFLTSNNYIEDALTKFVDYLITMETSPQTTETQRPQYDALAGMFSRYIRYLDPHDVRKSPLKPNKVNHLKPIMNTLEMIDSHLQDRFSDTQFDSMLRIKAIDSYMEKIWRGRTPLKAKETLRDLVALRFTLKSGFSPKEKVLECYNFVSEIIPYLEGLGFKPVVKSKLKDICSEKEKISFDSDFFYIPSVNEVPEIILPFDEFIKDYIANPKKNKYQGLHVTFFSATLDVFLEVQVKTDYMLDHSENHQASHFLYKNIISQQNSGSGKVDYRIYNGLNGFVSRDGETFTDTIGLFIPRTYRII